MRPLELHVDIAAEPATLFRFFTDPERFARRMGGSATGMAVPGTTIEPRPGGALRVTFPGGVEALGVVVEVDPPRRFVFTWGYKGGTSAMAPGSTRVTLTLRPLEDGTRLALVHEGIPDEGVRREHVAGWRFYASVLAARASEEQFAAAVPRLVADWFEAWNEADAGRRRAALDRCFDPDGSFRDPRGCVDGIESLDGHIANSRKHLPGVRLDPSGPPQVSHGFVRVPWRMQAGGPLPATGTSFLRLTPAGKIRLVVGFPEPPGGSQRSS